MLKQFTVTIMAAAALGIMLPATASAKPGHGHHDRAPAEYVTPRSAPVYAPAFTSGRRVSFPVQIAAVAVSAGKAKGIALRANRGAEYLDIKLVGGKVWVVRLIKAGQRFDVRVDARSGRIIG